MPRKKQQYGLGSVYKKPNSPNWYIQFYVDGRVYRESAGTTVYNEARKRMQQRQSDIAGGKVSESTHKVLVSELLADLRDNYTKHNPKSLVHFANGVIDRLDRMLGKVRASKVQTRELKDFVTACESEGLMPATINRHLALLRRAYKLGELHQPRKVSPVNVPNFSGHMATENNARRGFFEYPEYVAMRDALKGSERAALIFAYYSGCRRSEILNLRWEQVDWQGRMVRLFAGETKNNEGRCLPMGETTSELYQSMLAQRALCPDGCPWVFYQPKGKRVLALRQWQAALKTTGLDKLLHDMRRTAVRNMIRAGVPESVAMAISGHKTRAIFARYNITDEMDLHAAAALYSRYIGQAAAVCTACGAAVSGKFCGECGKEK